MSTLNRALKKRLVVILSVFAAIILILIIRLAYIQFAQGSELQKKAYVQQNSTRTISPIRGTIYDRNNKKLAISVQVATIACRPSEIKNNKSITPDEVADGLAPILDMDRDTLYKLLTKKVSYVTLKRKVDQETEDNVRTWIAKNKVKGINIDEDAKRYYPNGSLMCHVLGFTGDDNQGLMGGIEEVMEKYLKGTPGKILSEVDAKGRAIASDTEKRIDAEDGLNVVLTIDETIQYLVSKSLDKVIAEADVKQGAVGIVMDPRNGDILALVSKPDYDINDPYAFPAGLEIDGIDESTWIKRSSETVSMLSKTVWRDKAISDTYEPGSTFKTITTSAGLEEGVITPDTITNDLPLPLAGWTISCWRRGRVHGTETFREAVYNSCNPVFAKVALSLGIDRFYSYVKAFGFTEKTGIPLKGESKSIFQGEPKEIDMAVASFGQRFTITPLQLATAYTAVVNGGKLMKPRLVKELTDSDGNVVQPFEPEIVRTVISQQTSDTVRDILEGVVATPNGTGNGAYVKGYRIGGKTGTSQTTKKDVFIASFCGFAPADNPQIVCLVVLFDPKGYSHMGGQVAAPLAGEIIEDILNYLQVEREYTEEDIDNMAKDKVVPDVTGLTVSEAIVKLKAAGFKYKVEGSIENNSTVIVQTPAGDTSIPEESIVIMYTYKPDKKVTVEMPELYGKTLADARSLMNRLGLNIKVNGTGVALRQQYTVGTILEIGQVVEVDFKSLDNIE